jgi:hypothetical protein
MALKIDIINKSLVLLGEEPISSTNQKPWGRIMDMFYEDTKKSLLSMYPWRFAIKRVSLPVLDQETGYNKFKYKYELPSDCLLVMNQGEYYKNADLRDYRADSGELYIIEGRNVYSNINPFVLQYVSNVSEELFSPLFELALANKITAQASIKIKQNPNLTQLYESEFQGYISLAITNNEIVQDTQSLGDNSWVSIRKGWE